MFPLLIGIVFLGIGIFMMMRCRRLRQEFKASAGWKSALGQIASNDVKVVSASSGGEYNAGPETNRYTPIATYEFAADDSTVVGKRLRFAPPSFSTRNAALEFLKPYAPGVNVTVFYDPLKPSTSVLDRAKPRGGFVMMVVGTICSLLGFLITLGGIGLLFEPK